RQAVCCIPQRGSVYQDLDTRYRRGADNPASKLDRAAADRRPGSGFFEKSERRVAARSAVLVPQFINHRASLCNRTNDEVNVSFENRTGVPGERRERSEAVGALRRGRIGEETTDIRIGRRNEDGQPRVTTVHICTPPLRRIESRGAIW